MGNRGYKDSASAMKETELQAQSMQTFNNYVLGEPYQDLSMYVSDADIDNHRRDYLPEPLLDRGDYLKIAVGIDWGEHDNHAVIMGLKENGNRDIINMLRLPVTNNINNVNADIDRMITELEMYDPDLILADLGFNGTKVNQLKAHFGEDRVYGVKVNPSTSRGEVIPTFSETKSTVTIDKLTNNIMTINELKADHIGLWQLNNEVLQLFKQHWQNVIIRDEEDNNGELVKVITRKKGGDYQQDGCHHVHSTK